MLAAAARFRPVAGKVVPEVLTVDHLGLDRRILPALGSAPAAGRVETIQQQLRQVLVPARIERSQITFPIEPTMVCDMATACFFRSSEDPEEAELPETRDVVVAVAAVQY